MSKATGIHITDRALRLISLEHTGRTPSVTGFSEAVFDAPLKVDDVLPGAPNDELQKAIGEMAVIEAPTPVVICLPGGFFHIQKVPLEVASTEDRREQIIWEAGQALVGDIDTYDIDFFPVGRIAFWTAVRKEIRTGLTECFRAVGIETLAFTVEPLALYYALCITETDPQTRQAVIHWHSPWLTFTAIAHGAPIVAETIHICSEDDAPQQILIDQHIRQRVLGGEPSAEKQKNAFGHIHICGHPEDMHTLKRPLSGLAVTEIPIFDYLDTDRIAEPDAQHLKHPGAFAIASGAAFSHLTAEK